MTSPDASAASGGGTGSSPLPPNIPKYRIVGQLGTGGMGDVWQAVQLEPIRRDVAVKVIRLGHDSREILNRFEAEREALAMMDHPNIARILDAGLTMGGRPFFAMELVKGIPITEYCDAYSLPLRDRIKLMLTLCAAVQHAHLKGLVHRDLKPSNVLVGVQEGRPQLKVIDFGIAKAMGRQLTDRSVPTRHDVALGTPHYMSPEQGDPNPIDVDSRTDIYSLGVMLFELCVGCRPYSDVQVRGFALINTLLNEPMPVPSETFWERQDRAEIAARRGLSARRLRTLLRRDLDWIVGKATKLDRTLRYETASGLGADLENFLDGRPVVARPPSLVYQGARFVRRNTLAVAASGLAILGLLVALGVALGALGSAREAERAARTEAEAFEVLASALADVLGPEQTPTSASPAGTLGRLEQAASSVRDVDESARARVNRVLAKAYLDNGFFDRAIELYADNLSMAARVGSQVDLAWAKAEHEVARTARGRAADISRAIRVLRQESLPVLTASADDAPRAAALVHLDLGDLYRQVDSLTLAERHFRASHTILADAYGADSYETYEPLRRLGQTRVRRGDLTGADSIWTAASAVLEINGRPDSERAELFWAIGEVYWEMANASIDCEGCAALAQRAIETKRAALELLEAPRRRAELAGGFGVQLVFAGDDPMAALEFLLLAVDAAEQADPGPGPGRVALWFDYAERLLREEGLDWRADELANRREAYFVEDCPDGGACATAESAGAEP